MLKKETVRFAISRLTATRNVVNREYRKAKAFCRDTSGLELAQDLLSKEIDILQDMLNSM